MTLRVVLDTNTRVSALQFGGAPRALCDFLHPPDQLQLISQVLLDELAEVLERKFFWSPPRIQAALASISHSALLIVPEAIEPTCRDPDDDRVLECAASGQADFIVSGDKDLLVLETHQGIRIVTLRTMAGILGLPPTPPKRLR